MRQCPKRDGEIPDPRETAAEVPILAALVEEPLRSRPPAAKRPWGAPFGLKPARPAVSVPRRFSVGTMMILVTAFAMLLGILKSVGVPPGVFGMVAAFIAGVGACQVLLFKGRDPRRASFFGGMITFAVVGPVSVVVAYFVDPQFMDGAIVGQLFAVAIEAVVLGGPLGYAAGCLIAAIFLVRKEADDGQPPDEPPQMPEDGTDAAAPHLPSVTPPRKLSVTKLNDAWHEAGNLDDGTTGVCPECAAEAPDRNVAAYIRPVAVNDVGWATRLALLFSEASTPWCNPFAPKSSQPAVSVPRRFSVGTMMILVTAFAMLLGILKSVGVHPAVFGTVAAFIAGVGACQVLLFGGRDPRRASFFGGMITFGVLAVVIAAVTWFLSQELVAAVAVVFWGGILTLVLGGPLGYAAGCLIAAIFLVRKEPDDAVPPPEDCC